MPYTSSENMPFPLCRVPKGTQAYKKTIPYQPLKRLATPISSLRDFTRCGSSLTRAEGTLHDATASLHAAAPPYTATQSPYTSLRDFTRCDSSLTRAEGTLHGATAPLPAATPPYTLRQQPYTPEGPLQFKCRLNYERNVSRTRRGAADAVL